jgi:hypothetical protein
MFGITGIKHETTALKSHIKVLKVEASKFACGAILH